jgi:organic hydroperoxide reductase OsmC/OhrA
MLGTLNGALEVRGISLSPDAISASAVGLNEAIGGIVKLTEIRITYHLRVPAGSRETVDRALARHQEKCSTAMSLAPAVAISWTAEIAEAGTP